MKTWLDFDASPLRTGTGRTIAQHGEFFLGQIEDDSDKYQCCLLSLPCRAFYSKATFHPDQSGVLRVSPFCKSKARKVAELTLASLNAGTVGGELSIESEVPEAKGCGSSTADCVAAAVAAADSLRVNFPEEQLARFIVDANVVSDNFMFGRAVLFNPRQGVVLEDFAKKLPRLEVLGIDTASGERVKTRNHCPPKYSWKQLRSFGTLVGALRAAVHRQDKQLLARVATASAKINETFLPNPMFGEIRRITECAGALGIAVAHYGTVVSILLDPADELLEWKVDRIRADLNGLGVSQILRFRT
jgi:uncharacterized protein involved in propanediol utilization